jgi:hypothetical protein
MMKKVENSACEVNTMKIGPVDMEPGRVIMNHIPEAMGLGLVDTEPGQVVTGLGLVVMGLGPVVTELGLVVTEPGPVVTALGPVVMALGPVAMALGRAVMALGREAMALGQAVTVMLNSLKDSSTGKPVMALGPVPILGLETGSNLTDKFNPLFYLLWE